MQEKDIKIGDTVLFNRPDHGYGFNQERANAHLTVGTKYTVTDVEVASWTTDIYLAGHEGGFNSVLFTNLTPTILYVMPTEGSYIATWEHNGKMWSGNYEWRDGDLCYYEETDDCWHRVEYDYAGCHTEILAQPTTYFICSK